MYNGILLINKESGWSSFDVVAKVRGILQKDKQHLHAERGFCMEMTGKDGVSNTASRTYEYGERVAQQPDTTGRTKESRVVRSPNEQVFRCKCRVKVGHTGTLDPLAKGLMIVVVGDYCKRASEFSKLDKVYEVRMKLGETSTTGDDEGVKTNVQCSMFNVQEVEEALKSFTGVSMQTPPAFSAIKVDGKRAYELAREGKEVKIEPREITIYDINLNKYDFPFVDFTVHVGSGAYVRSLVEDIGKKLGTGAYMSALTRIKVGEYNIADSIAVEDTTSSKLREITQK